MARKPVQPMITAKLQLSADEMRAAVSRLSKRLEELDSFDVQSMKENRPPYLMALETSITRALVRAFGENTADFRRFQMAGELSWKPIVGPIFVSGAGISGPRLSLSDFQKGVAANINRSRALMAEAIRSLEEDLAETTEAAVAAPARDLSKVFIVHGHDRASKAEVAGFIRKLGFEAIILHERPNKGRALITKFREEAEGAGFAVVLMTPDDLGRAEKAADLNPRARQNVVFELGFFIGKLGPEHVAALVEGDIEIPSDFDGVVYISLDEADWQTKLGIELQEAGYKFDWNNLMRR
jgi:predicted nucleotide-binding protein